MNDKFGQKNGVGCRTFLCCEFRTVPCQNQLNKHFELSTGKLGILRKRYDLTLRSGRVRWVGFVLSIPGIV
jgi:hypothetical protein